MRNSQIRARLDIQPKARCRYNTLVRGSTAILKLNFDAKPYDFANVYQVTFMLKQGLVLRKFTAFDYSEGDNWTFDSHFYYDEITDCLIFNLSANETTTFFEPTSLRDLEVEFEIAIEVDSDIAEIEHAVIIEKQLNLYVVDSLYGQVLTEENDTGGDINDNPNTSLYVSNDLVCSQDLTCRN